MFYSLEWLQQFEEFNDAVYENENTRLLSDALKKGAQLKNGESTIFYDYWDRSKSAKGGNELFYTSNRSALNSIGKFIIRKAEDGTISIKGYISNVWYDTYDWHKGALDVSLPIFGTVYDNDAAYLQENGRAKNFEMRSSWVRRINLTIK